MNLKYATAQSEHLPLSISFDARARFKRAEARAIEKKKLGLTFLPSERRSFEV